MVEKCSIGAGCQAFDSGLFAKALIGWPGDKENAVPTSYGYINRLYRKSNLVEALVVN